MTRGVEDSQAQLADDNRLAVIDADVDKRGGTVAVHDHRDSESFAQLMAGGEVVGMGMGVQQILKAQAFPRGDGEIAVDLIAQGIDDDGLQGFLAADEIGFAATAADLFKIHHFGSYVFTKISLLFTPLQCAMEEPLICY